MKLRSLTIALMGLLTLALASASLAAEQSLSANDLSPTQLSTNTDFDGFTVLATAAKGVTIDAVADGRTAEDGEVFTARIKLNGAGALDYRAIRFTTTAAAELTVYLNSSNSSDARVLKVVDATGAVLAELPAPPDKGTAGMVNFKLPAAGEYLIMSASSGVNIYLIIIR